MLLIVKVLNAEVVDLINLNLKKAIFLTKLCKIKLTWGLRRSFYLHWIIPKVFLFLSAKDNFHATGSVVLQTFNFKLNALDSK